VVAYRRALDAAGALEHVNKPLAPRPLSALPAHAREAPLFESIAGYPDWRVAGALVSTRKRLALAMGCSERDIAPRFESGIKNPIDARLVKDGACQEVVWEGDSADLTSIPIPLMNVKDGGR